MDWVILVFLVNVVSRGLELGVGGWGILAVDVGLIAAYFTVCHGGRRGRTVGKAILGISVRDALTCGPIGHLTAFVRWLVGLLFWVFVIPEILDGFSPLWNDRRQAWHDRAVGTVVVRV